MSVVTERLWKEKTDVRCERLDAKPFLHHVSNDVKDVRDIVIGITGDETIGDHVLLHLGNMIFWTIFSMGSACHQVRSG